MRIIPGFIVREIAGENVAIPSGEAVRCLSGLLIINGCGRYLFELLQTEQTIATLVAALTERYDVDEATATADVEEFIENLRKHDMLLETL